MEYPLGECKSCDALADQIAKLTKTNLEQAAQIAELTERLRLSEALRTSDMETTEIRAHALEMMRNELLLMKRDKWHWQEARDRALSITPSQALADFAAKVRKQCAVICDGLQHQRNKYIEEDGAEGKPFVPRDCAEAIRNLKELP
jgi:predicted anti-sigma-YlaC factor YlaD